NQSYQFLNNSFSNKKMITGAVHTKTGPVNQVATRLHFRDKLGAVKVRWLIGRNNYKVDPGLYATGNPDQTSDVFVSANYKLSFDHLRKNLDGVNAWILVLDTKGVNVWCSAGKGTFGAAELVNRIRATRLDQIVNHRKIVVPQLGATGVSAYQVKALTSPSSHENIKVSNHTPVDSKLTGTNLRVDRGFNVVFGPVRAADIKAFIANGYKSTPGMRKVTFNFTDRIKLTPVDFVYAGSKLLAAFALIVLLSGLNREGISFSQAIDKGLPAMLYISLAYVTGIFVTPILLPYIPVRMFAFKGLISGLVLSVILCIFNMLGRNIIEVISWFLLISAVSSFMAMNFTGASTFTSLSGVKREMKTFVPVQISLAAIGLVLFVISNFKN
ncbi:MAG TPA: hypothetical protein VJ346_03660, partial [Bacteroidales bacterium]|nr:hypothetical protein [Bacteroidales bacterium]